MYDIRDLDSPERDRGVDSRDQGEAEAFENWAEVRPRRGVGTPRDRGDIPGAPHGCPDSGAD